MSAIGPGDWVERDPAYTNGGRRSVSRREIAIKGTTWPPPFGKIFRVRDMRLVSHPDGGSFQGLRLVGVVVTIPGHPDAFMQADAWRPVYRPNTDFIESLKRPAPALEPT